MAKKYSRIIAVIMLVIAIVFIFIALNNPQASFPWSNEITYILYEDGMQYEQEACREDTIASAFTLVYESEDGRIRIYET